MSDKYIKSICETASLQARAAQGNLDARGLLELSYRLTVSSHDVQSAFSVMKSAQKFRALQESTTMDAQFIAHAAHETQDALAPMIFHFNNDPDIRAQVQSDVAHLCADISRVPEDVLVRETQKLKEARILYRQSIRELSGARRKLAIARKIKTH